MEEKYILSKDDYNKLLDLIGNNLVKDKYFKSNICNIYFDTDNYDLIRNSIDKPLYKEKVRLRSYYVPSNDDKVFLEIKKKYKGITNKRRIACSLNEINKYLKNNTFPICNKQIMNEIDYCIKFNKLKPVLFLAYDRKSYVARDNANFRLTFDSNLRYRNYDLYLEKGDYGNLYFDNDIYIMEVKTLDSFPLWFVKSLSELNIYPTSFSKYGNVYKNKIIKEGVLC